MFFEQSRSQIILKVVLRGYSTLLKGTLQNRYCLVWVSNQIVVKLSSVSLLKFLDTNKCGKRNSEKDSAKKDYAKGSTKVEHMHFMPFWVAIHNIVKGI